MRRRNEQQNRLFNCICSPHRLLVVGAAEGMGVGMNREDIIRMAQEAGFFIQQNEIYSMSTQSDQELTEWIERFAALVASAEREAIAKMVEPWLLDEYVQKIRNRGQA